MSNEPTAENQKEPAAPEAQAGEPRDAGEAAGTPSAAAEARAVGAQVTEEHPVADEQPTAEGQRVSEEPELTPERQTAEDRPPAEAPQASPQPPATEAHASRSEQQAAAPADESLTGEVGGDEDEGEEEATPQPPRIKPDVPGLHLEVDIVPEGADPLGRGEPEDPYATDPYAVEEELPAPPAVDEEVSEEPISGALIDLAAGARYPATGKRKTAVARVILKPGDGTYLVNGRTLEEYVPRATLQRNIRQALETVGLQEQMDVIARVHGGGISAQAGALRHGVARALIEADPALRGELKRRGFLTRDARVKERKKAGLKKARKRPQFSKR